MKKHTQFLKMAVTCALILVTGCNLGGAMGDSSASASGFSGAVIEQAVLQPTPVSTLAVPPETMLLIADRYLLNGYYESAVLTYQMLLAQNDLVPAEMRAAALYGLGQSALREGLFSDAVDALTQFLTLFPNDARAARARFLRGDALLGLSRWEEAIADLRAYLDQRPGLIDSYALERIGDAQLALGQTQAALDSYKAAVEASRTIVPLVALRERLAQVYISVGRYTEAIAQYDAILSVAQNAPYRASIELLAARVELDAGQLEAGLTRLQRIFDTYPDRPEAYAAMQQLIANGRAVDNLARGRIAYNYGDYQGAVEAFIAYSTERPLTEVPAELHMMLGRAYRELGNTQAALTAFQTVIDQYTTDPLFGEALLEQGRTRFLSDDIPGAIEHYLRIANTYDYLPQAPEALWRAGFLYAQNDQPAEARTTFERLADRYPETEQARSGLSLAAAAAFNAGDYAGAERFYAELMSKAAGEERASAALQVGRLALRRGDNAAATQAFQQAVAAAPDSYYGARARDIILDIPPFSSPAQITFQFDDNAQVAEAEAWLRTTFNLTYEGALWPLSPTLEQDPRMVRGRELWAVAAYDEARVEFGDLIDAYEQDPLASYQLAIFLRGLAAYQNSIIAAANIIRAAQIGTLDAPPYIARMRYPAYYLDAVIESAERYDLDPLLLLALIRHESLFDTFATAAAGEKGLTQVIPSTGEYIATQLRWPDYQHSDLFRPYAGVEFGAYYLSEQVQRFDGNVTAALAAYNAGPGRASQWLEVSGGDHDLFLNAISIDSTRLYVQRIYSYYSVYRALYGA